MIGFGIDLAGYTTNKTSLAAISSSGKHAEVVLLRNSAFGYKRATSSPLARAVMEEGRDLQRCLSLGPVAIDIPIDLQGLPNPAAPVEIWELTKRPIDKRLGAMSPFADRIGAPVVRFAALKNHLDFAGVLGSNLFETYPTATWEKLGIVAGAYKARRKEQDKKRAEACVSLCTCLRIESTLQNDDDIDAIICAITAVAPRDHLCAAEEYGIDRVPQGFRLLKTNPFERISVAEADFGKWMDSREKPR